ncbi:MAG: phosphoglucosamine mutase [Proteobacteria bacterium]|nr:phosphoglucosamine mutase [Pseudomonadota bacterium]
MRKLFGTDGIRAEANKGPMRPESILKLAMSAASYFIKHHPIQGSHKPTVVIGKDTRLSGYMVESALQAGFVSQGMDVLLLGPLPTPAVALLTRSFRAQLGVMISASHNPAKDNGIKFFGPDGFKLKDAQEKEIENIYFSELETLSLPQNLGKAKRIDDASGRYLEFVKASIPRTITLDRLKIVVDCAHGAAYKLAPRLYWELGAQVIALNTDPTGLNINENCGATDVNALQKAVLDHKADIGLALDGDADRLIVVDEVGNILDGDKILASIALSMKKSVNLKNNTIAATQMSNLGFEHFLNNQGINLIRTNVGDRYVLEAMQQYDLNLGGEQSGHIIVSDFSSTGDGLVSSLQILKILVEEGLKVSSINNLYETFPQRLINFKKDKAILNNPKIIESIEHEEAFLNGTGRVYIRPSGTESLIRVMVEAKEQQKLEESIERLALVFEAA